MTSAAKAKRLEPLKLVAGTASDAAAGADITRQFIDLERVARTASSVDELKAAMTNAWRRIVQFDQALLVEPSRDSRWRVTAASGISMVDRNVPLVQAAEQWMNHAQRPAAGRAEMQQVDPAADLAAWGDASHGCSWPKVLWLPVVARDGKPLAAMLLLRQQPISPHEQALLLPLAEAFAHAWSALLPARPMTARATSVLARRGLLLVTAGLFAAAAFVPVPLSTLAPAEIVAADPAVVTAPLDGVIADLPLAPGAQVERGDVIATFVDVKARNDVEMASRNAAVAAARHFRVVQAATANVKDAPDLAVAKAEWETAKAELAFASDVLARTVLKAERSGLLIYAAKSDWIGKPVSTGERIMEIGDPAQTEVRIDLAVSDAIVLQPGGRMSLFLDGDPMRGIEGTITRMPYRPALTPDQQMVYRLFASLERKEHRRIGLHGTAKVNGSGVPLAFYLFRRPIAAVRQRIGL